MLIITNDAREGSLIQIDQHFNPNEIAVFDIETTGFSADTTKLYLIGVSFYENGRWVIRQWFNDDGVSEQDILISFTDYIDKYKYLMSYNGEGFDIPYLRKKLAEYKIKYNLDKLESVDLYKLIRPYKKLLHIDNLKQKTVEKYLGINRLDKYSGGDLIKIYNDFLTNPSPEYKKLLIQHNYEDIEGLLYCSCLMSYQNLADGDLSLVKMYVRGNFLYFSIKLTYPVPKRFSCGTDNVSLTGLENEATIKAAIIEGELKFFFDNYRDYYYLPVEDMAVHKSVAGYVDKNYRVQAKKDNCYTRKNGYFISQLDSGIIKGYKKSCDERETFIELADSFLKDSGLLNKYVRHIIKVLI